MGVCYVWVCTVMCGCVLLGGGCVLLGGGCVLLGVGVFLINSILLNCYVRMNLCDNQPFQSISNVKVTCIHDTCAVTCTCR